MGLHVHTYKYALHLWPDSPQHSLPWVFALAIDLAAGARWAVVAKVGIGTRAFAQLYAPPLSVGTTAISFGTNDGGSADADALRSLRVRIPVIVNRDGTVVGPLPANSAASREAVTLVASESLAKVGRGRDVGDIFPRLSCDKCRQKPVRLVASGGSCRVFGVDARPQTHSS